jgi:guanylate kinase
LYGSNALSIFIKPPSFEILKERLKNRKTENKTSLSKRIKKAQFELTFQDKFDKVLVNDVLENSFKEAENLVRSFLV